MIADEEKIIENDNSGYVYICKHIFSVKILCNVCRSLYEGKKSCTAYVFVDRETIKTHT